MTDHEMMQVALNEARLATAHGDVPVGAIVVHGDTIIASRHNERHLNNDPTAHAEVLALRDAASALNTSHLVGATLVTTLEPCPMCAGAAWLARVDRVVFGAEDPKAGALGSLYNLGTDPRLNHEFGITPRVLEQDCAHLLQTFFEAKR